MSSFKSAKRSRSPADTDSRIASPAADGRRSNEMSALDGNQRIAYLREALEDARWLRHGSQATETGSSGNQWPGGGGGVSVHVSPGGVGTFGCTTWEPGSTP